MDLHSSLQAAEKRNSTRISHVNDTSRHQVSGVRWPRTLLVGLILVPLNCYAITLLELVYVSSIVTGLSIFYNAVVSLLLVMGMGWLLSRLRSSLAFRRGELALIFAMVTMGSALASHSFAQFLLFILPYPFQKATPPDAVNALIRGVLPDWLVVTDTSAAGAYFASHRSFFADGYLSAWLVPLASWSIYIVALLGAMLCLNLLLYRYWMQSERLSFPVTRLPLSLIVSGGESVPFWRTRGFWIAAGLAGGVDLWNQATMFWPSLPFISKVITPSPDPASPFGYFAISLYPFFIGLAYFMPQDLAASAVVFFFLKKLMIYWLNITGGQAITARQWDLEWGAWVGFGVLSLWLARTHLRRIGFLFRRGSGTEPPPQGAVIGLLACLLVLVVFCRQADMSPFVAIIYLTLYLVFSLGITKTRAQLGPPFLDFGGGGTTYSLVRIVGPRSFSSRELSLFSLFSFHNHRARAHPMPHQIEQFYLGEKAGIKLPMMAIALFFASIVALAATYASHLTLAYSRGIHSLWPTFGNVMAFGQLGTWLGGGQYPDFTAGMAAVLGFGTVLLLSMVRNAGGFFFLHPVGFAMGISFECLDYHWAPIVIASLSKTLILRYGGLRFYARATPIFLGLTLGEFVIGAILAAASLIIGRSLYTF